MKKLILLFLFVSFCSKVNSQNNIVNTLGSGGVFSIKCGATTYLSLSQSNGLLDLNSSLRLPNTTSSTVGVIFKGADRFLHNYGYENTFLGINSGNFTMTGSSNTGVGCNSLFSNENGRDNTAIGSGSLILMTYGYENTAVGSNSLHNHTGLFATAIGCNSMASNTTGYQNTSVGSNSLPGNTTGSYNTSLGVATLYYNTTGSNNTTVGSYSLFSTTGNYNTAIGRDAGSLISTGNNNTAIGYTAQVPTATSDNQVRIGNTSVGYAGVQVAWTITSDRRWKENILSSNLGLDFISRLNPVSYTRKNDESQKTEYGLIAQDVEQVLKYEGVENPGMITVTDEGNYELRYNDLLAPMIKAVQELKTEKEELKTEVDDLKTRLIALEQNSGTTNKQTAGFLSGNININFLLLLVFSTVGFAFFLIKRYSEKREI